MLNPIQNWFTSYGALAAGVATPQQTDQVARILAEVECHFIITEHSGHTDEQDDALTRIAEAMAASVFEFMSRVYQQFPRCHPLYGAGPVKAVVDDVNAILLTGRQFTLTSAGPQ
ncbi:hypothetical protein JK2ML_1915 [Mycobacterium leprae Kyoto-2]|uniref:Uncharacterized protein n=3 Tax=Mycobacterium leprae TaxID=1769 RepID=Q9CBJ3_MYCLE|nr:hypothetical protein [Mycobacterium leprae]CAR72012.1 hypothetical protein MLBr01915 [Mycobacterium leprae Br4923]AWV48334.1 hypothetical protein DIJ64_10525 [Mycobacterium leprae]OAR20857.1 hypothetical protein A8144_08945 [Mycobacterium leprae 3125609]OAX70977.1 hypothetical protein A3216_08495 [Mycobacterium leprae 7935681]CAC30870.1 hypothetical protein [Mycobacterium leprae]